MGKILSQKEMKRRWKARDVFRKYRKENNLKIPKKCEKCESTSTLCAHHPDYSKPLKIEWLCRSCHGKAHVLGNKRKNDMERISVILDEETKYKFKEYCIKREISSQEILHKYIERCIRR